jgi:CheY-like chemotaxis protein
MSHPTVLYIEDDVDDVALMQHAWKRVGVRNPLQIVGDGEEARRYLAGEGRYANRVDYPMPSLVLLDLKLPKVPGLDVLTWIRQQPALHTLRVIVVSSSLRPRDAVAANALGIDAYLVKPTRLDEWRALVDTLSEGWLGGG